jgi:hypothetical protein
MNFETEGRENDDYTQNTDRSFDTIAKLSQLHPGEILTNKIGRQKIVKHKTTDISLDFRKVKKGKNRASFLRKS